MNSETVKAARRAAAQVELAGRGAAMMASSVASPVAGEAFGTVASATRQSEEGDSIRLFVLDRDTLDDAATYLGSEPLEGENLI